MKTLLIITFIDFWRPGAGHRTRLNSLIQYLISKVHITVVYLGVINEEDDNSLKTHFPEVVFEALERNCPLSYRAYGERFALFIEERTFDVILVEYLEMAFMLTYLKTRCKTILDPHDILNDKIESFQNANLMYNGLALAETEEFELYDHFDFVLAIQDDDFRKICRRMGTNRTLLVPHGVNYPKRTLKDHVSTISFIGSEYLPNVDAITNFLNSTWGAVHSEFDLELNIYGNVCSKLPRDIMKGSPQARFHGFLPDLNDVYENTDIMINPVRCGAGLKIKNVEAIANGLPLITTSHGAIGLKEGIGKSFLVADDSDEFVSHIQKLVDDIHYRIDIAENAYSYGKKNFSSHVCYARLLEVILN